MLQNAPERSRALGRTADVSLTGSPTSTRSATALTRSPVARSRRRTVVPVGTAPPGARYAGLNVSCISVALAPGASASAQTPTTQLIWKRSAKTGGNQSHRAGGWRPRRGTVLLGVDLRPARAARARRRDGLHRP